MEIKSKIKNLSFGFTLIELLVVISIIGLLASVVLVALNSARAKSRDVKRETDMNQLSKAMEMYFNDNFTYPTVTSPGLVDQVLAAKLIPKYLVLLPKAPTPADVPCVDSSNQGDNNYYYENSASGNAYTITFCLGNSSPGGLHSGTSWLASGNFK